MTLASRLTILAAIGVLAAVTTATAGPGPPDPSRSTICSWVKVVGYSANGSPDAEGLCCITLKDFNGNTVADSLIEVDFSDCCDINLCGATGDLASCTPPIIKGLTDAQVASASSPSVRPRTTASMCSPRRRPERD